MPAIIEATVQKLALVINTDGMGLWSSECRAVNILGATVSKTVEDDEVWGELRVIFDIYDWDINKHGLIYTDKRAQSELKAHFNSIKLDTSDMGYSEQGMQGSNFISFDVGKAFIDSWEKVCGPAEIR